MWKSLTNVFLPAIKQGISLQPESVIQIPLRTTFILKRRYKPQLHKRGMRDKRLKPKHYIYDLVEDTNVKPQPLIDIILTSNVDGVGRIGERCSLKQSYAYNKLLLPGLAVYATPEYLEKYKDCEVKEVDVQSTITSQRVVNLLTTFVLDVQLNKETPWVLKPWHISTNFLKRGYHVPEETITMPEKEIKGPNMDMEGKVFFITITINNFEKVRVLCRIKHWATDITERTPPEQGYWLKEREPLFAEEADEISKHPQFK